MPSRLLAHAALVVALAAPPAQPQPVAPYPHLAGTLPAVEEALLGALRDARLAGRLMRVAADTNGHLTAASLVFTYSAAVPDPVPALEGYASAALRAAFAAVPTLDEVDLTAYHQNGGPMDAHTTEATFTAAVSRAEWARIARDAGPREAFNALRRVWYHPVLLLASPEARAAELGREPPRPPFQRERPPTFTGSVTETITELTHRNAGRASGRIVADKLYRGDPTRPVVALTFDDGPVPIYTTLLLDTLDRLGLKATFFLIGRRVQEYPYFAQAIVAAGHEVANHTFHHLNLTRLPDDQVPRELAQAQEVIATVTGRAPRYFRPPGGDYDLRVLRAAKALGLVTVFWTDDPGDYAQPGLQALEGKLLGRLSNGGIVLLHQGVEETIRILPLTVEIARRRGYAITTVSGMLAR